MLVFFSYFFLFSRKRSYLLRLPQEEEGLVCFLIPVDYLKFYLFETVSLVFANKIKFADSD